MPLASLGQRSVAYIIDLMIVTFVSGLLSLVFSFSGTLLYLSIIPFYFLYHLFSELFNRGQSLGKMITKIRVISLDGKEVSAMSYMIRWAFRLIDIAMGFGTVAALMILGSDKGQRLGDILAGTTVISTKDNDHVKLPQLIKFISLDHEVTYPQVKRYGDREMLLLKDTLQRHRTHRNQATIKVIHRLSKKYQEELGIPKNDAGRATEFLETLLKDYIILTR